MVGSIYLVGTPIGNLSEITLRAISVLKEVKIIYCEDTRVSKILLNKYMIKTPTRSLFLKGMVLKIDEVIDVLKSGSDVAVISDAGLPIISDPGFEIVKRCHLENIKVIPVGGVSSITSAIIASGLCPVPFLFLGFLPLSKTEKETELLKYSYFKGSIIILESPRRIIDTLNIIKKIYINCNISISKEISKIYEKIKTGPIDDIISYLLEKDEIKGEFVIIIEKNEIINLDISIMDRLSFYLSKGLLKNDAIKQVAKDLNKSKKEVYQKVLKGEENG